MKLYRKPITKDHLEINIDVYYNCIVILKDGHSNGTHYIYRKGYFPTESDPLAQKSYGMNYICPAFLEALLNESQIKTGEFFACSKCGRDLRPLHCTNCGTKVKFHN